MIQPKGRERFNACKKRPFTSRPDETKYSAIILKRDVRLSSSVVASFTRCL